MYLGDDAREIEKLEALLEAGEDIYWLAPAGHLHRCIKIVRDENYGPMLFTEGPGNVNMLQCERNQFIRLNRVLT